MCYLSLSDKVLFAVSAVTCACCRQMVEDCDVLFVVVGQVLFAVSAVTCACCRQMVEDCDVLFVVVGQSAVCR